MTHKSNALVDLSSSLLDVAIKIAKAEGNRPAFVYSIENGLPGDPAQFEQEAQNKADYLESVLLTDGETTPGQRTACCIAVSFFETCGILTDADVYGSDRVGLVAKALHFAYGIDRAAEQHKKGMCSYDKAHI